MPPVTRLHRFYHWQRGDCLLDHHIHLLPQVVKHPVTKYLPTGATRIALSHKAPEVKDVFIHVKELPQDTPVVFIVGAFASGKVNTDYADQEISISQYPLSAAQALTRITNACEQHLQIV